MRLNRDHAEGVEMKFRKIAVICILFLLVVTGTYVAIQYLRPVGLGPHLTEPLALDLLLFKMISEVGFVSGEGNAFQLIEGDVSSLEQWLTREYNERVRPGETDRTFRRWLRVGYLLVKKDPSGELRLVDSWGHRLVYRCPHPNPAYVCQLYSIGPNGIDEGGQGDDIENSFSYESISDRFEDPNFDGNVYKKFRGQFTVVTIDGSRVIRHP